MSRYAVIGHPVSHSKSPIIHRLFAQQSGRSIDYSAIDVRPENLASFIRDFFRADGAGLNVTLPHKEAVHGLVDRLTVRARLAGAVNTCYPDDDHQVWGDNTDGVGLLRDLTINLGVPLAGKRILVLGAGGAVRGALGELLGQRPHSLTLANRTLARAQDLQLAFAERGAIQVSDYASLNATGFDVIINGTSMGLQGEVPPVSPALIGPNCCCYDMVYGNTDTAFVEWAKNHQAAIASDGLGMLVEQAAESYFIWKGIIPDTAPVISQLRAQS